MSQDVLYNIRKIREIKNYSQSYMATELDVCTKTYSRLETGETELSVSRLEKIAKLFDMSLIDLYKFDVKNIFIK